MSLPAKKYTTGRASHIEIMSTLYVSSTNCFRYFHVKRNSFNRKNIQSSPVQRLE